jgi:uncharacterized tellurite resistance protein B-like protein
MAPDNRYHTVKPSLNDNVVIYKDDKLSDTKPSGKIGWVSMVIRFGVILSRIDNVVSDNEVAKLNNLIEEDDELIDTDKKSLRAFLRWCMNTEQNITGLKQAISNTTAEQKKLIGHFLISLAFADGHISMEEVTHLQKTYASIGLNKDDVISDIHSIAILMNLYRCFQGSGRIFWLA